MTYVFFVVSFLFLSLTTQAGEKTPVLTVQQASQPYPAPGEAINEVEEGAAQLLHRQFIESTTLHSPGALAGYAIHLRNGERFPELKFIPEMNRLRVHEIRMTEIESSPVMYTADAEFSLTRRQILTLGKKVERYHLGLTIRVLGLLASVPITLAALLHAFSLWHSIWCRLLLAVAAVPGWYLLFLVWRVL